MEGGGEAENTGQCFTPPLGAQSDFRVVKSYVEDENIHRGGNGGMNHHRDAFAGHSVRKGCFKIDLHP